MNAAVTTAEGEAAIFSRLLRPEREDLSPDAARSILKLAFGDSDCARMHELAAKGRSGPLSEIEETELENYCRVGRLLELLHSKARLTIHSSAS